MIPASTFTPPPPALKHGVEGYVPEEGTVAKLDPDIEASIVDNINGPIDATLANLTKAHYEVFGSLPSWSLTADLLDSGEVEFPTYEEALRFFQTIKRSYAASGKEWQLDAQGTNAGLIDQRERQKGLGGFGPDSDVLDPEMLASWAPKSVDDFLFGPYMKKTDANRVTGMSRQGRLRLDEMLIQLPKQWAISNLSNRLSARSRRFNPDRDEDEAMMLELNQYLAARIPKELAPAPTAAWQNKTEEALRYLQMMRASSLYMASGGEDDDASGFLHTQGYSNIISTLEEQIRLPADQTGRTDEARRAWVQDWFVRSRNPGVSEKMAIHQLANLNLDMVTIAGQRQIGYDHLAGYAGTIKGWFEGIPGAEQVASVFTSDEFQRVVGPAVSLASDVASFVSPAVVVPLTVFAKSYEFYDKYVDAFQSAVRAADDSVLATVLKPVVLPLGWVGLVPGQPDKYAKALSGTDAAYSSLWSEFFTQVFKDEDDDGIEWVGDFTEHFKDNLKRREQGLPADYATEVLTEMDINPLTHPEIAFLATFALDSVRDLGVAKVAGIASTAIKNTDRFLKYSELARSTLHEESAGQMFTRKFKDALDTRTLTADEVGPASVVAGKQLASPNKNTFVSGVAELFGLRGDDVAKLWRVLHAAHAQGRTDDELLDLVRRGIGTPGKKSKLKPLIVDGEEWTMARSGRSNLRADNWGLSYRMREKALLDPDSVFYRGKHPVIAGMFERLWSSSVVPVSDERLPDAVRQIGFSYRTMIRSVDLPWAGKFDIAMLHDFGDMESITELRRIIASGDNVRYAGFIEGLYADSEMLARRGLQMAGKRVTEESLKTATRELRERLAQSFGFKVNRRMLMDAAGARFAKRIWHTHPEEARAWNAMARAVDPSKPGDFVPQGLEHMMWESKKSFDRKLGKGEIGTSDIGAIGIVDNKIMAPHQGAPTIKRQLVEGGPEVELPNEQSVAHAYDEVEPQIQAYRDLIGLDPDSGMPPGIIQEMAKLEAKGLDEVELEMRAVQAAHKATLDHAISRHEAGIVKAMREKKTLDEQLELLNVLRAKSEARSKQLEELRAAKASPKKIRNAAKRADKAEQKAAAATIEVVRSKLPAHKELMAQTKAKAEEVRLSATERQGIKERLGRIQLELQSRLRLESEEPQLMAEHARMAEAEQRVRQHYLDAVDEEAHWSSVIEFADTVGHPVTQEHLDAWRMSQAVVRERQTSWKQINERTVNARIAAGQGRHLGEGRPRVQLRLYDPGRPDATPLDVAVNVDLPESDLAALAPPPWIQDEYLMVLRRYGDAPAIRVLQEWLAEQLYGYTKRADLDPRVVYSREQIQAMTQQLTDAGYPPPIAPTKGPAPTPRSVKTAPGAAVPVEQMIEDLLVDEQKLISWAERAKQAWLDAYQEHRLIYRDAPGQTTMRGIREAENMLMEKKPRPVSLREPTRRIITGTATAAGPSMRRSAEGAKEIVEGSKATRTYIAPTQRGMRESARRTEIYFDSYRQLDQRLKAVQARINGLTGRTAPYHEIPTGDLTPPAPLVAETGTEAEAIAVEQAGPFLERGTTGKPVSKATGAMKTESGYEGVSEEALDELSDARVDKRSTRVVDETGEVEVPPNQALHDTLARIASVGYSRGNVTLRVPMIGWGVGRMKAAGTSPETIKDAERFLTEAKLGARGAGEPFPLITDKRAPGLSRIPEYETFTEMVGRGKKAHEVTYTRVKRGKDGEIVYKKDKNGRDILQQGPKGGGRRMDPLDLAAPRGRGTVTTSESEGRLFPVAVSRDVGEGLTADDPAFRARNRIYTEAERPIDVGSQGPRFNAHEMYGQLTGPADQMDFRSDMGIRWGGQAYADPATKTLYVRGLVGGDQIDLFNALRANGTLDEGWTITHSIPEEVNKREIFDVERMLTQVHGPTVDAERKFAQTYSELLGQVLDQMFRDGRNAPVLANVDELLAERLALRTRQLSEIELPEFDVRSIISGIQDGSDTGGLMAGLELGIPTRGRAHASFGRQSGKPFIEGPQYEVVGTDLRTRTIANIKDSDFTVILVQGTKKFDQVVNATVRGGGGTGLTMRECVKNGKPYIVIDIESPAAVSELQTFLKGKRGVMNVAGPRATNDVKVKDVLVAALRKETGEVPNSFEIVKMPFGTKSPAGVIDGHRAKGKNVTNAKPGEPGALGNPFVAKDAGGKLTREEAVAKFEEAFLKRVKEDPEYRAWVLTLRGKKVGYYKPDEEFIHLQVVQRWLEKQGAVGAAEDIVANAPGSAMLPLAGELRESFDQTVEKIHHELRSTQAYIEAKRKEIDELEAVVGPLEELGELDVRGLQDTSMMKILFLSWDKRLMGRFEKEAEELQARLDDALALAGKTEAEVDAAVLIRETEEVLFAASENGKLIAAAKAKEEALADEAADLFSDGHELTVELENERKGLERVIEARDKGEDWGPDQTWEERIAESEQSIAEIEAQLKQVDVQFEAVNRKLDEFLDPYGDEGKDFRSGAVVDEADEDMGGYAGRGEDYDGRQEDGPQPDEGPRELSPVEASGLTADELSAAAVSKEVDGLTKINAAQSIAHTQARSAEYRFLRAQRELRELEIKLHASEQDLAADLARIRGGTDRRLTEEDVENLRAIVNWLDAGIPVDKVIAEAGKELDENLVNSAAHTLWLLQNQPDQALRWAVQPSREWQLLLYADLGHNPARLAKFLRGGATRRMESVWSNKFLFNRWSVDDGVTLYKTIVMAKISTMLRITMADEFTRLFAENMNPYVCLKQAKALKAIDKLPEDIQFKLSEMIGRAVDGPMVLFDISHPKAWTAYRHILVNDRRDVTFVRYLWGKQLSKEERAAEVQRFLATETKDVNFVKMIHDYQDAGDEFRAWYALGYREEQGLRGIGSDSHRVIETGPDSEMLTRQTDEYAKMHGPGQDQYADARNLPDHLVQDYDWWTQHPLLGGDWKPSRSFTPDELKRFKDGDLTMPSDMRFGDKLRRDIEPSRRNWNRLKEEIRQKSKLGEQSQEELKRLIPGIWGHADGSLTGGIPVVRTFRDQFYRILDYSGSKLNEMVYASAFTAEKKLLMAEGLAEDLAERNAAFYAREYTHRVMFNNATYMGEDMLRNFLLFLPAYRQFVQYWVPYLATHPGVATLAYRANRDKDQFQNMRVGPMTFDLSRMSFLINQGDNRITGWLPSGGPLITMPVSYLTQDAEESSLWGSLAGNWPLEYAGEGMPLHSPLDKVVYGLFGKTLPWPFGSNGDRNPWRELQLIRAAELKGQRLSKDDAYWQNRMNRLKEGGWNFVVPIGMRFIDEDAAKMQEARAAYNAAKTPEEVDALLSLPENSTFKTFIEWQNKPSWDQLSFLKQHPEIVPYMVSGFEGRRTNERDVGFLWSKLRDIGAADPAGYIDRIDEKVAMINRVVEAIDARKARDEEVKWWNSYKKKHSEDHNIARLQFEWQNSEGEFAQGGIFWQQGKIGYAAHQEDLNGRFTGLVDPFTGLTSGDDFDSDSYRLAKLMDESGGHAKALLQLSPNYDMYVYAKLQEHTANTTSLLETFKERRMATRMTPQDVRRAGYSEKQTTVIMTAVKSIDELWDTADKACAQYGKYGYATTEGRAIRKKALEYQNGLIESSPLLKGFLGDNITAMYGESYLTKPAYEREDLIRLDDMDEGEREAFYRVKARKDENGRPMWNGLFVPEGEKKLFEDAQLLGYVPTKDGWMTKIQLGNVVGLIKGKVPAEGKQITLTFERAYKLAENMQEAQPDTIAAEAKWLKTMKSSMPAWAERLIEDGVRAACWKAWLDLARRERHNLRTTINEYYSDAPGFSLNSKYGMRVKKNMLSYAKLLGEFEPTFGREFRMQNSNNEMLNSILGWYL